MKVGVIGTGRMGQLYITNLLNHHAIEAVWVFDPLLDRQWASELGCHVAKTESDFFHATIDAVIICSPSKYHTYHIECAASAQKAMLCEKPIGLSVPEIEKAIMVCKKNNVLLQVGFNRRFDKGILSLKEKMPLCVGDPHVIKITSRDPQLPPESYREKSGHLFMDMSIHDFDMVRFIAESEVTELYAQGSCLIDKSMALNDDIDTALIQLRFVNGAIAVIDNSRQARYGYDQRVEVFSNKGILKTNNEYKDEVQCFNRKGLARSPLKSFFIERYNDSYERQLDSFITSVQHQKHAAVSGFDGLQAVKLALAAIKSLKEKKVISMIDMHYPLSPQTKTSEKAYV